MNIHHAVIFISFTIVTFGAYFFNKKYHQSWLEDLIGVGSFGMYLTLASWTLSAWVLTYLR